ncbi:unnamed protein product, partial [Arabidopsis halleri]
VFAEKVIPQFFWREKFTRYFKGFLQGINKILQDFTIIL